METPRVTGRVPDGMMYVSVPQIILNQAGIQSLIGQSISASMPEHMRMHINSKPCFLTIHFC